jgi:hypothetical protein
MKKSNQAYDVIATVSEPKKPRAKAKPRAKKEIETRDG